MDKFDQLNLFCLSFDRSYFGEPINIEAKTHKYQPTKENSQQQIGTFTLPSQFPPFFSWVFLSSHLVPLLGETLSLSDHYNFFLSRNSVDRKRILDVAAA